MDFSQTLRAMRLARGLTQQELAEASSMQALQIRRYEAGTAQPLLSALHNLAIALQCTTDELIFGNESRGPQKTALRYQMEAIEALPKKSQTAICDTIDALLAWHSTKE